MKNKTKKKLLKGFGLVFAFVTGVLEGLGIEVLSNWFFGGDEK